MRAHRFIGGFGLALLGALAIANPVAASHAILNQGSGTLSGTYWVDLDLGTVNATTSQDVQFHIASPTNRYLAPNTTVAMLKMGSTRPSYSTCAGATLLSNTYDIKTSVGKWFCVKTDHGRLARLKVVSKMPYPFGVDLMWTTWKL